jgi:hypothetical protein
MPKENEVPPELALPRVYFRTVTGWILWPTHLPEADQETDALRIRRAFVAQSRSGESGRCVVEITTSVRGLLREVLGRDPAPGDELWDDIARGALSRHVDHLGNRPLEPVVVFGLSKEELRSVELLARTAASQIP